MNDLLNEMNDEYQRFSILYDDRYDRPANECVDYRRAFNSIMETLGMVIRELEGLNGYDEESSFLNPEGVSQDTVDMFAELWKQK